MLRSVEDGAQGCLQIFLQYVFRTKFPNGLSTEEEWKYLLECVTRDGESLDEEATGAGLVELASGRFLERFQIQLSIADGKARYDQIMADLEGGDLLSLGFTSSATTLLCPKDNESEAMFQSRIQEVVDGKHVAESQTSVVSLFDLGLAAITILFQNKDAFKQANAAKLVMDTMLHAVSRRTSSFHGFSEEAQPDLSDVFAKTPFLVFMQARKLCEKKVLSVVAYIVLFFFMNGSKDLLVQFLEKVCSRCCVCFFFVRKT